MSPLPALFLTEAVLKVIGGSIFFFSPATILRNLVFPPFSKASLSLIKSLGTQTIAFSIPLFLAARSDPASVKSRRIVYWTILGREGLLGLGLLAQIGWIHFKGWREERSISDDATIGERERLLEEGLRRDVEGEKEDRVMESRRLRKGLWLWIAELVPFVVARIWILQRRMEWFE